MGDKSEDGLVRYVQLQAMQRSQEVLFDALGEVLLEMNPTDRLEFCQSFQGQILESLESNGAIYSAHMESTTSSSSRT